MLKRRTVPSSTYNIKNLGSNERFVLTCCRKYSKQSGAICLHAAAMKGHTSVIRALLQKGAPVDAVTKVAINLHLSTFHSLIYSFALR